MFGVSYAHRARRVRGRLTRCALGGQAACLSRPFPCGCRRRRFLRDGRTKWARLVCALAAPLPRVSYRSATGYAPYGPNPPFVVRECVTECPNDVVLRGDKRSCRLGHPRDCERRPDLKRSWQGTDLERSAWARHARRPPVGRLPCWSFERPFKVRPLPCAVRPLPVKRRPAAAAITIVGCTRAALAPGYRAGSLIWPGYWTLLNAM